MPAIPAMNIITVKETMRNSTIYQSETFFLNKVNHSIKKADVPKHLILYFIIYFLFWFRLVRGGLLEFFSWSYFRDPYVRYPLLNIRGEWLMETSFIWYGFWLRISDKLGWNWDLPQP